MTTPPDIWRQTAEAYKARCEQLEGEVARLKAQGAGEQATTPLDEEVEAMISRYSFGNAGLAASHRTYARTQIAAGALPSVVAAMIRRGAYEPGE